MNICICISYTKGTNIIYIAELFITTIIERNNNMSSENLMAVENMFMYRKKVLILGLTGRTGSGCSKVASILKNDNFNGLDLKDPKTYDYKNADERKQEIIYNYMKEGNWKKFHVIEGSAIIISFILEKGYDELIKYLKNCDESGKFRIENRLRLEEELKSVNEIFDVCASYSLVDKEREIDQWDNDEKIQEYYDFYMKKLSEYKTTIYGIFDKFVCFPQNDNKGKAQLYTYLLQTWGNNIRSSGNPYEEGFSQKNYYDIAKRIDLVIKIIQKYDNSEEIRICIDAIRNTYESIYFKDNYSNFALD